MGRATKIIGITLLMLPCALCPISSMGADQPNKNLTSAVLEFMGTLVRGGFNNAGYLKLAAENAGFIGPDALLVRQNVWRYDPKKDPTKCGVRPMSVIPGTGLRIGIEVTAVNKPVVGEVVFVFDGNDIPRELKGEQRVKVGNYFNFEYLRRHYLLSVTDVEDCSANFTIFAYDELRSP